MIINFQGHGIIISGTGPPGGGGHLIERNHIGADQTGTRAAANGEAGIFIEDAPNNTIRHNLIGANQGSAILIEGRDPETSGAPTSGAKEQKIISNIIGTDPEGRLDLSNGGTAAIAMNGDAVQDCEPQPAGFLQEVRTDSIANNQIRARGTGGIYLDGDIPRLVKVVSNDILGTRVPVPINGEGLKSGMSSQGRSLISVELNTIQNIDSTAIDIAVRVAVDYNINRNQIRGFGELGIRAAAVAARSDES